MLDMRSLESNEWERVANDSQLVQFAQTCFRWIWIILLID